MKDFRQRTENVALKTMYSAGTLQKPYIPKKIKSRISLRES